MTSENKENQGASLPLFSWLKNFELAQVVGIVNEFLVIGCLVGIYSLELVPVAGILEFIWL